MASVNILPPSIQLEYEEGEKVQKGNFGDELKNLKNVQQKLTVWGVEIFSKKKLSREDYDSFVSYCNEFNVIIERTETSQALNISSNNNNNDVLNKLNKLEERFDKLAIEVANGQNKTISFAEAVQLPKKKRDPPAAAKEAPAGSPKELSSSSTSPPRVRKLLPKENVVIVKPAQTSGPEKQSSVGIREIIKKNINREQNLNIKKAVNIRGGGVLLVLDPKTKKEKVLGNKILQHPDLKVSEPQTKIPRVILYHVPSDLESHELANDVYERNLGSLLGREKFSSNFKPLFKLGPKNKDTVHWVVECSPDIRRELINKSKICIDWRVCRVGDYIAVSRCFKCQKIGHISKYCSQVQNTCSHCANVGHDVKDCPNKEKDPCCLNCRNDKRNFNHKVGDKDCPSYQKALQLVIEKTDYGI
jgi:hypothetical protein